MGGSVTAVGEAVCAMVTTSDTLPDRLLRVVIFYSVAEALRSACRANERETAQLWLQSTVSSQELPLCGVFSLLFTRGAPSSNAC